MLVNDFGAINIDAELVIGVKDDVVSLANGCVCCTIRDDLIETVVQTINRAESPEYILLEPAASPIHCLLSVGRFDSTRSRPRSASIGTCRLHRCELPARTSRPLDDLQHPELRDHPAAVAGSIAGECEATACNITL